MRAAPTIQQRPDSKLLSKPEYGPFLCQGRLERVHLRKNQEMDLEEHPVKYYNQFMDRRGRRLIGVHKQAYAPPEKDAPQGSKILAGESGAESVSLEESCSFWLPVPWPGLKPAGA